MRNEVAAQSATLIFSEGLAPKKNIDKNNIVKYGFVNTKGKVIIPLAYDTIYTPFKHGLATVGKNKKAGVLDKKGNIVIAFEFSEIGEISKSMIPVKSSGLWGFYSLEGKKIIQPSFQNFRNVSKSKILVQKDGRWGMINHKGEFIMECTYLWIQPLVEDKKFKITNLNVWTIRSTSNQVLSKFNYDSVSDAGQGLLKFSVIGKYGLMDKNGNVIVNPYYDEIGYYENNLVRARKNKYGVIDKQNKVIIPFEYDNIYIDSLYIRVMLLTSSNDGKTKEKWGLFDLKGNKLIAPKYANMNSYSEGMIAVMREDGTWGYISPKGATEIIFRYSYGENFNNGVAKVNVPYSLLRSDHPALIDKEGDYVVSPAEYGLYQSGLIKIDKYGKASYIVPKTKYKRFQRLNDKFIKVENDGKFGVITTEGKEIIPPIYDRITDPSETGLFVVYKDDKKGVVDRNGKFTYKLNNRFDEIFGFHEGYAKMLLKDRYGFIDMHGDVYISPQYPFAGEMHDSMVSVVIRDKWGFLDNRENLKVQPYYEDITSFKNGVALVKENGLWNIVNKQGKQLHRTSFENIIETKGGNYLLINGERVGMADKKGREMLAPRYESIQELEDGFLLVKKNGLWGVLDYKENFVLPIEFDIINYIPELKIFITGSAGKIEEKIIK